MKKLAAALVLLAIAAAAVFFWLTIPERVPADLLADIENGDATRGERVFYAGGCTSCHAAPGAKGDDRRKLAGGLGLKTPFGTFHAPNISPDPANGIGQWSGADFANAMLAGVSPRGSHYYPAFPYSSYVRMTAADVADLWAYMKTLPAAAEPNRAHELPFPFNVRRGLGLWKLLFLNDAPIATIDESNPKLVRGRYLVEGPGHCGECHTPRNWMGGMDLARWLAGGPAPEGNGRIPNITPHDTGIGGWSEADIAYALESGFTPEFDSFGGAMADVQQNTARLPAEDREAIAAYLKAIPAVAGAAPPSN
jgi:mono/diheme cytochrome c family protein